MIKTQNTTFTSIREGYEQLGAEQFYFQHGEVYKNPHEDKIKTVFYAALKKWKPSLKKVLDLACGSGEITSMLLELGYKNIDATDPYTQQAFISRTKRECLSLSFEDIVDGKLFEKKYSLIICSYAMHLAKEQLLPSLSMQLALISEQLLILSPHKRPIIRPEWGWEEIGEIIIEKVHAKLYKSTYFEYIE